MQSGQSLARREGADAKSMRVEDFPRGWLAAYPGIAVAANVRTSNAGFGRILFPSFDNWGKWDTACRSLLNNDCSKQRSLHTDLYLAGYEFPKRIWSADNRSLAQREGPSIYR